MERIKKGGIPHEKTPPVVFHCSDGPGGVASQKNTWIAASIGIGCVQSHDARLLGDPDGDLVRFWVDPVITSEEDAADSIVPHTCGMRSLSIPEMGFAVKGISYESHRKNMNHCNLPVCRICPNMKPNPAQGHLGQGR